MSLTMISIEFKCPKCDSDGKIDTAANLSCIEDIRCLLLWQCPICSEEILPKDVKCVTLNQLKNFTEGLY